ncbi:hypothetical protein D9M70_551600 [compost metagenome]
MSHLGRRESETDWLKGGRRRPQPSCGRPAEFGHLRPPARGITETFKRRLRADKRHHRASYMGASQKASRIRRFRPQWNSSAEDWAPAPLPASPAAALQCAGYAPALGSMSTYLSQDRRVPLNSKGTQVSQKAAASSLSIGHARWWCPPRRGRGSELPFGLRFRGGGGALHRIGQTSRSLHD